MRMRLKDKSVVITGATGSIGKETAKLFKSNGAKLALLGRDKNKLDELQTELGTDQNTLYIEYEARNEKLVAEAINQTTKAFGSLDAVVAYAGTEGVIQPLTDYTIEDFSYTLEVNVTGVWLLMKHATPVMTSQKSGSFIAISSGSGVIGTSGLCPYTASKHAVNGMIKTACIEFGSSGVRFNVLAPGPIANRMMESLHKQINPENPASVEELFKNNIPMGRYGTDLEIAQFALFLASDESTFCNGGIFLADGGLTAG